VSGEAILSAENSGKPLGGRGSAQNHAGELTALPGPYSWRGAAAPPQEPHPWSRHSASIFGPTGLIQRPPQQSSFPSS